MGYPGIVLKGRLGCYEVSSGQGTGRDQEHGQG